MNVKSCPALSPCDRLPVLLAQVPQRARTGLERFSPVGMPTCFLMLTFSIFSFVSKAAKLDDVRVVTTVLSFRGRENTTLL